MRSRTPKFVNLFLCAAAFLFAVPFVAFAQPKTPEAPHWLEVTTVTVRPDKIGEFRTFMMKEFNPALVKGGVKTNYVWNTALGGAFTYYFVTAIDKFADYDGPSPIEKALGADAEGTFFAKAGALVTSVRTTAMMERPDLTYIGKMDGPPKLAVMIGINVNQGHEADFENFMKNDYLPAFSKSDAKAFLAHQTVFGGRQNEFVMLGVIDNFADLDKGHPIARVLGRDGFAKLMQKLPAGSVSESEMNVIKLDLSLSIIPAATK